MATDWAADVKKYAANADDAIIAGLVRYLGIALRNRDSSLVSFSDPAELALVRNNFLKKKLGLTHADTVLDAAIAEVGTRMKGDRTKNRVTVYYLLAEAYNSLHLFEKKTAAKTTTAAAKPAKAAPKTAAKVAAGAAGIAAAQGLADLSGTAKVKPAAKVSTTKAPAKAATAGTKTAKAAVVGAAAVTAAAASAKPAKSASVTAKAAPVAKAAAPAPAPVVKADVQPVKTAEPADKPIGAGTIAAAAAGIGAVGAAAASAVGSTAAKAAEVTSDAASAAGHAVTNAGAAVSNALSGSAAPAAERAYTPPAATTTTGDNDSGLGWLPWLLGIALLGFLAWWLFSKGEPEAAPTTVTPTEAAAVAVPSTDVTDLTAAPAEGSVTIPTGAGVTAETRDGKPVVKVYFDSGKTDVVPAFAGAAGGLKAWLDNHAGSTLAVSGYNDPTGNAARNAELSKNRAQAVGAALVSSGIPEASVALVKPDNATDATVAKDAARRVEVTVK